MAGSELPLAGNGTPAVRHSSQSQSQAISVLADSSSSEVESVRGDCERLEELLDY